MDDEKNSAPKQLPEELTNETRGKLRDIILRWIGEPTQHKATPEATAPAPVVKEPLAPRAVEQPKPTLPPPAPAAQVPTRSRIVRKALTPKVPPAIKESAPEQRVTAAEKPRKLLAAARVMPLLLSGAHSHRFVVTLYRMAWGVFVLVIVIGYGGLFLSRESGFRSLVVSLQRFSPVAYGFVAGRPLWTKSYHEEVQALKTFYRQQDPRSPLLPNEDAIETLVHETLIRRAIAEKLAVAYGVHIADSEIDGVVSDMVTQAGSAEAVVSAIDRLWGWSINDYKRKVVRPYLLKQRLLATLSADPLLGRQFTKGNSIEELDHYLDSIAEAKTTLFVSERP